MVYTGSNKRHEQVRHVGTRSVYVPRERDTRNSWRKIPRRYCKTPGSGRHVDTRHELSTSCSSLYYHLAAHAKGNRNKQRSTWFHISVPHSTMVRVAVGQMTSTSSKQQNFDVSHVNFREHNSNSKHDERSNIRKQVVLSVDVIVGQGLEYEETMNGCCRGYMALGVRHARCLGSPLAAMNDDSAFCRTDYSTRLLAWQVHVLERWPSRDFLYLQRIHEYIPGT